MHRVWSLNEAPTPAYVIHKEMLDLNLATIDKVRREAGVEVIVALKANATWHIFPELKAHSDGATASSLAEARLVVEYMGVKAHTYAPVYTEEEIDAILDASSHITFNSLAQYERYHRRAVERGVSCGLRVNPEYSTVETDLYNPAMPESRLGVRAVDLDVLPEGIEGLHFHSLCESRPEDLEATLRSFEERFGRHLDKVRWVNFGGGHLMTHTDYDKDMLIDILRRFKARHPHLRIILEPGSAFTWDTGVLVARVEEVVRNGGRNTLMLNVSFACHMPDCLEMPYWPAVRGAETIEDPEGKVTSDMDNGGYVYRLGANSCLSGDFLSSWRFDHPLQIGEEIIFEDMIHYTTVKTCMFNGIHHPSLTILREDGTHELLREYSYEDYRDRMD